MAGPNNTPGALGSSYQRLSDSDAVEIAEGVSAEILEGKIKTRDEVRNALAPLTASHGEVLDVGFSLGETHLDDEMSKIRSYLIAIEAGKSPLYAEALRVLRIIQVRDLPSWREKYPTVVGELREQVDEKVRISKIHQARVYLSAFGDLVEGGGGNKKVEARCVQLVGFMNNAGLSVDDVVCNEGERAILNGIFQLVEKKREGVAF